MHPTGLYLVVTTSSRVCFLGVLRAELQPVADFPLLGAGRVRFSSDGGKFAVGTPKQVRRWSHVPACPALPCPACLPCPASFVYREGVRAGYDAWVAIGGRAPLRLFRSMLTVGPACALCAHGCRRQVAVYRSFGPSGPEMLGALIGHSRPVTDFTWTHADTRIVTVGDDGAAVHWDLHKCGSLPCLALPCPALPCPALPCLALP
jgi:hypothetical protein